MKHLSENGSLNAPLHFIRLLLSQLLFTAESKKHVTFTYLKKIKYYDSKKKIRIKI